MLRPDWHIVTSFTEPDFGHVKKFCIFLFQNLQISNHVTIRVLQGCRMAKIGANCRKWLIYWVHCNNGDFLIHVIRGKQVMLDRDLARLYGVEARALNQAVQRNIERSPDDFMFQLSKEEFENWKSQIAISNSDSSRIVSYCSVLVSVLFCLFLLHAMQVSMPALSIAFRYYLNIGSTEPPIFQIPQQFIARNPSSR